MLNTQDRFDRKVIAAVREFDTLSRRRYTTIKVEQPIQRGWRRSYVLSARAATRRDRSILEAILGAIGTVVVHHSRDFRRRHGRRRKLVEIEQPLRPIPVSEWERKGYPPEWFAYFRWELLLQRNHHWQPYSVFRQPEIYELTIHRNWLWYFQETDPAIETRLSELDRWLRDREGWQRYSWLKGKRFRYRWPEEYTEPERSLRREHDRQIRHAMEDFPEVDATALRKRRRISPRRTHSTHSADTRRTVLLLQHSPRSRAYYNP